MGPKAHHRTASAPRLAPNSRTSSSTKLAANLHFTQKEAQAKQPQPTLSKKSDVCSLCILPASHSSSRLPPQNQPRNVRISSSHRIASKDQLQPPAKRSNNPPPKSNGLKPKKGFIIASSPSDEADDDEWISSESGAATPNRLHPSDSADESAHIAPAVLHGRLAQHSVPKTVKDQEREQAGGATPVPRVDTVDSQQPRGKLPAEPLESERSHPISLSPQRPASQEQPERRASLPPMDNGSASFDNHTAVPRPPNKRHSTTRPPSTHSISSRHDTLRPHPLIRGQSYGATNKLAHLAMTSDISSAQISSSSPVTIEQSMPHSSTISISPTNTISDSSSSPSHLHQAPSRRTSISSARSVATLPVHTSIRDPPRQARDRNRTLSAVSSSSSSAAISSLAHIPATRPPSPQRFSVIFPPPSHPQFHTAGVHSLLPPPYLTNHLTTLAHRTPLRESYDRVRRAKLEACR
ncbi:hypothetical protein D9757_005663 [Collybiopsis confluens]|uniref:Uncharacterized protein n=1 Tax=Collybiopsis confluens TaxID=2823264 RepID=A0A8H5HSK4_9AGAR|nr:hypothetical protein D9757_005663 [Collybiopsis confluens]